MIYPYMHHRSNKLILDTHPQATLKHKVKAPLMVYGFWWILFHHQMCLSPRMWKVFRATYIENAIHSLHIRVFENYNSARSSVHSYTTSREACYKVSILGRETDSTSLSFCEALLIHNYRSKISSIQEPDEFDFNFYLCNMAFSLFFTFHFLLFISLFLFFPFYFTLTHRYPFLIP